MLETIGKKFKYMKIFILFIFVISCFTFLELHAQDEREIKSYACIEMRPVGQAPTPPDHRIASYVEWLDCETIMQNGSRKWIYSFQNNDGCHIYNFCGTTYTETVQYQYIAFSADYSRMAVFYIMPPLLNWLPPVQTYEMYIYIGDGIQTVNDWITEE